jgi:hypothetical protein
MITPFGRISSMKRVKTEDTRNGQSYVELSIFITMLIILLAGLADFGRAYLILLEMRDAALEGAAYGSFAPMNFEEVETRVRETMKDPVDLTDPTRVYVIPALTNPSFACAGFDPVSLEPNEIKVSVIYHMPIGVPFLGAIIGSQEIPLTATVSNTILRPSCK